MNTYCEYCQCWHKPDGSKADGPDDNPPVRKIRIKKKLADGGRVDQPEKLQI